MAEGGSPQESIDNSKSALDTHLLDCPICLEQLHQPKSLPCLHSFCQECLSTFITKDLSGKMAAVTSFPCPVCRKITQPVNPSEGKEKWAQQFPTNNLIESLVKVTIDEPKYCKPCEKKGKTGIPAAFWCETLNIMLCRTCKVENHDMIHEECEIANLSNPVVLIQQQEQVRCGRHAKKMTYYCEDHKILGCSRCITIDHRRCDHVTTAQEYYDKLKRDSKIDDWKTLLQKTIKAIELMILEFDEQFQGMANDQATGLENLNDIRKMINTRLDALQKNTSDKLISLYKEEKENLQTSMQKYERLMSTIQNTIEMSENAIERSDIVGTILLYQRGKAELESYKNMITDMQKYFTSVRIKHVVDPGLFTLDEGISRSLGEFMVEKVPRRLPDDATKMLTLLSDCSQKNATLDEGISRSSGEFMVEKVPRRLPDDATKIATLLSDCSQEADTFNISDNSSDNSSDNADCSAKKVVYRTTSNGCTKQRRFLSSFVRPS